MNLLAKVKIKASFYPNITIGKISLHQLNGTEILRFLEKVELRDVYRKHARVTNTEEEIRREDEIIKKWDNVQELLTGFYKVHIGISNEIPFTPSEITDITSVWNTLFLQTFYSSKVTPYMHIFVCHLHEFKNSTVISIYLISKEWKN